MTRWCVVANSCRPWARTGGVLHATPAHGMLAVSIPCAYLPGNACGSPDGLTCHVRQSFPPASARQRRGWVGSE